MKRNELVGNDEIKNAVSAMIESGRLSRSIIIYGEKGTGKKTAARYISSAILCESPQGGRPCFECTSCRMAAKGGHPDHSEVSPSGRNGIYRLDSDLRPLISEAYIRPSQSEYRVAAVLDMDSTPRNSQNVLLKLAEEPPSHMVLIMTACSKEYFLPTILSRVMQLKTQPLSKDDCRRAVMDNCGEFSEEKFAKAFAAMGGNAGRCIEFMQGSSLSLAAEVTPLVCLAAAKRDEYGLAKVLWKLNGDKQAFVETLRLFSQCLRDCAVMSAASGEASRLSFCKEETEKLSASLGMRKAAVLFELCESYISRINGNAALNLALNSFCAEVTEILLS